MYLESNFKTFKQNLEALHAGDEKTVLTQADNYSKDKQESAHNDAYNFYKNSSIQFEQELQSKRTGKLLNLDLKYKKKHHDIHIKASQMIKDELEKIIDKDFDSYAKCFVQYLDENFDTGEVTTYKRFKELEKFNIKTTDQKQIIFCTQNKIIKISTKSIMDEYEELIKNKISQYMEN